MEAWKAQFLDAAHASGVLRFGEFTLKSGRVSPWFFNAGLFQTGKALADLGSVYAAALAASGIEYDLLFGPAYKGIPLVSATAIALARETGRDVPWVFNRKEAKDHGEGGTLVGAPLEGRVVIVDDVITAGTAIREVMALIEASPATPTGVLVAIDREERGQGELSAIQEVERDYGLTVVSVASMTDVETWLAERGGYDAELAAMAAYRAEYGIES